VFNNMSSLPAQVFDVVRDRKQELVPGEFCFEVATVKHVILRCTPRIGVLFLFLLS
jgi:hypothetical protein